jgi:hypothetical protein
MKNAALSVLVVLVLAALLLVPLSMFEVTKEAAKPIVGGLPLAIPAVHQLLQKSGSRLSLSPKKRGVVSFHGFTMPVVMLAIYGILVLTSVSFVGGFLTGFVAGAADVAPEKVLIIGALTIIPQIIVAYFVGRWIGIRSQSKGLFAVLAVAFVVPLIDSLSILIVGQFMVQQKLVSSLPSGPAIGLYLLITLLVGVAKYGVPLVLGYWRGRVSQSSRYLVYLLRALPQESRDTLVNLASDEAKRLATIAHPS